MIICKRGLKGMLALVLLLVLTFLFSAAASAATVADIVNNSLRVGNDIYELNHTTGYTYDNVLASIDRGGQKYYFKIDNRWYDLMREDINTLSDLLDPGKAVPAAEVRTWVLDYRYGAGDIPEELEPLPSTYSFEFRFSGGAVLESEDTGLTVAFSVDKQGAVGYDATYIAFSAAGPGEVTFKTVDNEGEDTYENEGCLDAFILSADYAGSTEWILCFSSAGDYTITFKLMDSDTGDVIAESTQRISIYPTAEIVLAGLEACICAALDGLGLGETGVSSIDYAEGEALVCIDEPDRLVHEFVQSLAGAFKEPLEDVAGAAIYVGGEKAGAIENPAAMSDGELIEAIGDELIRPLSGGEKPWSEIVLGDLEGKSASVKLTVALGAAEYSATYDMNFAINQYSVSIVAAKGTVQGAGSYAVGTEVNLKATADDEYVFYSWGDGEGEEVSKSNPYSFAMPNREIELIANFFRSEAIVDQDSTLAESYMRVDVVGDNITLDLGGNTVVRLSIAGSNVTLQNGTVVNLNIERGVENVVLEDFSDDAGGNHIFAGGGSGSIVLRGHTNLKGTIQITSRDALGICSQSAGAVIGGDVIVKTIRPVAIAAPVQGEIRVLAAAESITIQSEVSRITALADTVIRISSSIDEPKRPQVERAAGVDVSISIVDEQGEETGETAEAEGDEALIPADVFIFSIDPLTEECKVNATYNLPATVKAVLSDRNTENVAVIWDPAAVDTGEAGMYPFSGTVEGYDEAVELTLMVYRTHMVSFEAAGGCAVDEQEIRHGELAVEPAEPSRMGYTFCGWYKDETFNYPWSFTDERITESLTLYARWTANTYKVTFDPCGGNNPAPTSKEATYDSAYGDLAKTTREGYTFMGWYTKATGGEEMTADDSVAIARDHTLYAHWNINRYTITFDSAGGNEIEPLIQDYGTAIAAPADPVREGYNFAGWQPALPETMPAGNLVLTAQWSIKTYTVTFMDHDKTVLDTQTVDHGAAAAAPEDPEREGYAFNGWDNCFEAVESDLIVTAKYIDQLLVGIRGLIDSNGSRTRPGYTSALDEWDNYWGDFCTALDAAEQLYTELEDAEPLPEEQKLSVTDAEKDLQRAVEILDGIEDFDLALGGRENPKGLVETVYGRSLVSDGFQPGRMRCYYEKESGNFYWMLSGFVQEQGLYEGTTGTGMNPGLQNVMMSDSIVKLQSGELVVNIYHPDGTRKTKTELENNGIALATYWLEQAEISHWIYKSLVGLVEDCKLIGRTSDGTEFMRTYSFRFVDGGTYLFDHHFRYCVVDDLVQKDFEGYSMINVTRGLKYSSGPIQAALDEAEAGDCIHLAAGNYNESITINKSISLIGNYREGIGAHATVLDGAGIGGAPGIRIAAGVENVSIQGFEIKGFDSGGIAGEGGGIDNVIIENNFIHDLGGDAVVGRGGAAEPLTGWTVAGNRIENFGGSGIAIENIGSLVISNNRISRTGTGEGLAIGVTAWVDSGAPTISGITIKDNEIADCAVNVTALSEGSGEVTVREIDISGNTLAGGSIEVQTRAESSKKKATIEYVSVSDNHIEFSDKGISVRNLATPGDAHFRFITIKNNELTGGSTGIELHTEGGGYNNLRESTITGNHITITDPDGPGCAVSLTGVKGSANFPNSFTKNSVTIEGSTGVAFDGIHFSGKDTGKWNITDNILNGNNTGSAGSGIHLSGDLPAAVDLNMSKNRITGWAQGILTGNLAGSNQVKIQSNWIYDNADYGIANGSGAVIDATLNFWGHAEGPLHDSNPEGLGNAVTDNVNFNPWYLDEGFEGRSDGAVYNAGLDKYYKSIQAALDAAAPGDTVKVIAGIFNEGVTINKSVTLTGSPGSSTAAGPGSGAPIIDGTGKGDHVSGIYITDDAGDVVIEGFEIRNFNGAGALRIVGHGDSISSLAIRYNHIHCVIGSAILLKVCSGSAGSEAAIEGIDISGNIIECNGTAISWQAGDGQGLLKDIAIKDNILSSATGIHAGCLTENLEITGNSINSRYCGAEDLGNVSGSGIFSGNTVTMVGLESYCGVLISRDGAAQWAIDDNVLDGNNVGSVGLLCRDLAAPAKIDLNRNTVTGWARGVWVNAEDLEVTLRLNLIYGNYEWGVIGEGCSVDAMFNYWGDASGPGPEGSGNGVEGDVEFYPWYIDAGCTVSSDQEIDDQDNVDAAIAMVPAQIASLEVPGGSGASAGDKNAAVKAYIENLEGMAVLRVTVTVEAGTNSGFKVTITRGDATPGIKDNVQVTKFVIPPADQEAAGIVIALVSALPSAANVNIGNYMVHLAAIEQAEAAFNSLTGPQKTIVGWYLEERLYDLVIKVEGLVLEELDNRIMAAIDDLKFEGTGIGGAQLVERRATLFIDDPEKKAHQFVESGVVSLFESMFQDVVGMRLGDDPTWYGVEGTTTGAIEAGAQIVSVVLELPYEYGETFGGVFQQLAEAKLEGLIGKDLSIEVKIQRLEGGREYTGEYVVAFSAAV